MATSPTSPTSPSSAKAWTDQDVELEELRAVIFPRDAQFPYASSKPGSRAAVEDSPQRKKSVAATRRSSRVSGQVHALVTKLPIHANGGALPSPRDPPSEPREYNEGIQTGDEPIARDPAFVERLLCGRPKSTKDLTEAKSVVRFFSSSTFTDTKMERDIFIAFAIPYLRAKCRARGLNFQLSEMRFGINDGLSQSHKTSELCMAELDRCARDSAGLNFVGILGSKYGFRPFPAEINAKLFKRMMESQVLTETQRELLDRWFELDLNKDPAVRALRPVQQLIPLYNPNCYNRSANEWWSQCFEPMQAALRAAATQLEQDLRKTPDSELSGFSAKPYIQSVTEDEMQRGFNVSNKEKSLLIIREFVSDEQFAISELSDCGKSGESIPVLDDHNEENEIHELVNDSRFCDRPDDADARKRLAALKKEVRARAGKVLHYKVPWREGGIDPFAHAEHASYLGQVVSDWTAQVEHSIEKAPVFVEDFIAEEAQEHLRFALRKGQGFVERNGLVKEIEASLVPDGRGIVVRGMSGSGKTSLMALAALRPPKPAFASAAVVVRFLGTTPDSKKTGPLLRSLCAQISRIYTKTEPLDLPLGLKELGTLFRNKYLNMATARQPLLLVLDSLDQLVDGELVEEWLPAYDKVPNNVCILVSTLPELFESCVCERGYPHEIKVGELLMSEVETVLDRWLKASRRKLSAPQRAALLAALARDKHPTFLLLRVLFNEAILLRSGDPVPVEWARINNISSAIEVFFDRIEKEHGSTFVSATMSLLSQARDGLSCEELEDLLSLDDGVLKEAFQWWVPPVARLPPLLLTRLLSSLGNYIVTKQNVWFHRQFREAALRRYSGSVESICSLADYFSDKARAESYMLYGAEGRHTVRLSADRGLQPQPTILANGVFNERRFRELPPLLMATGRYEECLALLMDTDFVAGMIYFDFLYELLELLSDNRLPVPELREYYHRALTQSRSVVSVEPALLEEHLWARLYPVLGASHPFIRYLDTRRHACEGLHEHFSNLLSPANSPLVASLSAHVGAVEEVCTLLAGQKGKQVIITAGMDKLVKVWDPEAMALLATMDFDSDVAALCSIGSPAKLVVGLYNGDIEVFETTRWQRHPALGFAGAKQRKTEVQLEKKLKSEHSETLDDGNHPPETLKKLSSKKGSRDLTRHQAAVNELCAITLDSSNQQLLVSGSSDNTVKLWNAVSGELITTLCDHDAPVNSVQAFSHLGDHYFASTSDDCSINVYLVQQNQPGIFQVERSRIIENAHGGAVYGLGVCKLAHETESRVLLVSGAFDHSTKIWDIFDPVSLSAEPQSCCIATLKEQKPVHKVLGLTLKDGSSALVVGSGSNSVSVYSLPGSLEKLASWDENKRPDAVLHGHTSGVRCLCALEMEQNVAVSTPRKKKGQSTTSTRLVSGSVDCHAMFWDLPGTEGELRAMAPKKSSSASHQGKVTCACVFTEKKSGRPVFATGGEDCLARVWDTESGQCLSILRGHKLGITAICFVNSATTSQALVTTSKDETLRGWDPTSGELLLEIQDCSGQEHGLRTLNGNIYFASERNVLRASVDGQGTCDFQFTGHGDVVRAIDVICAHEKAGILRNYLISGAGRERDPLDCSVRLFDATSGDVIAVFQGHTQKVNAVLLVNFQLPLPEIVAAGIQNSEPAWELVAVSGSDDRGVIFWDCDKRQARAHHQCAHSTCVDALELVPRDDTPLVVSAARCDALKVWDPQSGNLLVVLPIVSRMDPRNSLSRVAPSPSEPFALVAVSQENEIHVIDPRNGQNTAPKRHIPDGAVLAKLEPGGDSLRPHRENLIVGCGNGHVCSFRYRQPGLVQEAVVESE